EEPPLVQGPPLAQLELLSSAVLSFSSVRLQSPDGSEGVYPESEREEAQPEESTMTLLDSEDSLVIRSKFRSVVQLRLQQKRTRERRLNLMHPLKSSASFQEQTEGLESIQLRGRETRMMVESEKHKLRSGPDKPEAGDMNFVQDPETNSHSKLKRSKAAQTMKEERRVREKEEEKRQMKKEEKKTKGSMQEKEEGKALFNSEIRRSGGGGEKKADRNLRTLPSCIIPSK
ncbi:hypothetical protein DNTS_016185, partial [Danionella cerebrum]